MMRIVLLGKTGAGKSSLANTILGEKDVFKESCSANSETKICQTKNKRINERKIDLVDTPGLFDTDLNSTELSPEILKCIKDCAPGPHAFLIVLKVERFTKHDQEVVDEIIKYFSKDALKYTTVVFTHGEQLDEKKRIKEWVNENKSLTNLVDKCGGRCHVFDNKYWNNSQDQYRNNQVQVKELLETIDKTVTENGGGFYINTFLKMVIRNMKRFLSLIKHLTAGVLLAALLSEKSIAAASLLSIKEGTSPLAPVKETDTLRIVLLGKVGSGKSSLGNTIFGDTSVFKVNPTPDQSNLSHSETRSVNGRNICLIDTAGLIDTDLTSPKLKFMTECLPGPHAFLIVLKVERHTEHEQVVEDKIFKYFSEEALKYTTVVFTRGDYLPKIMKIEEWVTINKNLRKLVDKCGGRCHVFDNKYWNNSQDQYRNNQVQVKELLETIDKTVRENEGKYYTNEMLQNVFYNKEQEMVDVRL